ncbi:Ltp family lipoprotein [Paenibacillus agaridevorans]|uniref:Ltp family lipoprotein n=1 Tax=Paenibacillus agaridevorans TaxID=171404 RepID=UPI001BE41D98|nr:Ltp family lipoprotein [Paenibacillus agaridevorans]
MAVIGLFSFFAVLFFIVMAIIPPLRRKISPSFTLKKSMLFGLIAFIVLVVAFSVDSDDTNMTADVDKSVVETESKPKSEPTSETDKKEAVVEDKVEVAVATPEPTVKPTPEPTVKETASQRNAVRTAKNYLEYTAFSRKGLIEQLVFEGYDNTDAEYAVDRVNADWNEQAALKAKDYLEYSSFSEQGLIEQLEFEGFTNAQAKHGVSIAYE